MRLTQLKTRIQLRKARIWGRAPERQVVAMTEKMAIKGLNYSPNPVLDGEEILANPAWATQKVVQVRLTATPHKGGAVHAWARNLKVADLGFAGEVGEKDFAAWALPGDEVAFLGGETTEEVIAGELRKWLATKGGRRYRRGYNFAVEGISVLLLDGGTRYLLTRRQVHVLPSLLKWKTWEDAREPLGIVDLEQLLDE